MSSETNFSWSGPKIKVSAKSGPRQQKGWEALDQTKLWHAVLPWHKTLVFNLLEKRSLEFSSLHLSNVSNWKAGIYSKLHAKISPEEPSHFCIGSNMWSEWTYFAQLILYTPCGLPIPSIYQYMSFVDILLTTIQLLQVNGIYLHRTSRAGLLNYFKKGSSYKCRNFPRSGHSHEIMQMWHILDFSNKNA